MKLEGAVQDGGEEIAGAPNPSNHGSTLQLERSSYLSTCSSPV